jgi:hypothetical protein
MISPIVGRTRDDLFVHPGQDRILFDARSSLEVIRKVPGQPALLGESFSNVVVAGMAAAEDMIAVITAEVAAVVIKRKDTDQFKSI